MKKQVILAVVILIAIIIAAVFMIKTGPRPARKEPKASTRSVNAIKLTPISFRPVIHGYGEASPEETWAAVTQISGKIIEINPAIKNGRFLRQGDLIVRIDPTDYQLASDKAKADIAKITASIDELAVRQKNLTAQMVILNKMLDLNKKNLERNRTLHQKNAISDVEFEKEELTSLQQENSVSSLQAELNLIPSQQAAYNAQLAAAKAALRQAELNVEYTTITAPFNGRVTDASATLHQFTSAGTTICKLDSTAKAEIETSVAPELLSILPPDSGDANLRNTLDITVESANQEAFRWQASFLRYSEKLDPNTRMVSLVVGVDSPYAMDDHAKPHMPLSRGTFCKVSLKGPERAELVIPRQAVHDNTVYLIKDDKLVIQNVTIKYSIGAYSIVKDGLKEGDVIATSDIVPAIPGMALTPSIDADFSTSATQALTR